MGFLKFQSCFNLFKNNGQENVQGIGSRVAQRRQTCAAGQYKVLNRDRFYGRHYSEGKNRMSLIDISTTGCAFMADTAIPKGSYLEIELAGLSDDLLFTPPLAASCETVYYLVLAKTAVRIGVKFLDIDWRDVEKIRQFSESTDRE